MQVELPMLSRSLRRVCAISADSSLSHVRYAANTAVQKTTVNNGDIKRIKKTAKRLIHGAKQGKRNPEWKHTYAKSGEAKRIEQDVLAKKDSELHDSGAVAANAFAARPVESWSTEELLQSSTTVLQPGTFFELRRSSEIVNGVVLSTLISNVGYNGDVMSITTRGDVIRHRSSDVMFAIPNFVDSYLVERCGDLDHHENEHQLAARLRVVKAAREFDRVVEKEQYRLGRAIRDVYPQVRARDSDEWGKVTTLQVARMLDAAPNVPITTLFAVHKQLMDRADEFVCHPSRHRFVHSFDVRPLSHLKNIEVVKQMVREKSPVIHNFREKAKLLIDRYRQLTAESEGEAPSVAEISDEKFTPKEQEIITFLKYALTSTRRIQQDPYEGNIPALIKDTNRYDELITSHIALIFLREIGVYTPWEDIATKDKDLHLPPVTEVPTLRPVTASSAGSALQKVPVKTSGLLTADAHENVRHDFGDMPVYVIDDAHAEELDDGVSVETVPGEPNSTWIHVHVADPTSFLPVTHPLARQILKQSESYYFGHKTYPMLPEDVVKLSDMGRDDVRTVGQKVLTFSAKIGSDAQILDYKARAGIVRNVQKLRYDDVDRVLLPQAEPPHFTPFEPEFSDLNSVDTSYVLPHVENVKRIYELTRRICKERIKGGVFIYSLNKAEVSFLDRPVLLNPSHVVHPIFYRGYPKLRYHVLRGDAGEVGSRSLIAECMKIAGRVASRFCLDYNIPAIRRSMARIELDDTKLSRILAARSDLGYVDVREIVQTGVNFPSGEATTKPAAHWLLGIPEGEGYSRSTSPLRRADDMIMHWQIKSALLPNGGTPPPIDEDGMKRILEELNGRRHVIRTAHRRHTRQWAHTYIKLFMEEAQKAGTWTDSSNILRGMDAIVVQNPVYNQVRWSAYQDLYLPKLGVLAVLPVSQANPVPIGSMVKVNMKCLFSYDLNPILEAELA